MSDSELACVYSALILHDAGINITVSEKYYQRNSPSPPPPSSNIEDLNTRQGCVYSFVQADKLTTLIKAADVEVEPFWPGLFSKALEGEFGS